MSGDVMEFPRTPEEFCRQYGFFDKDEVYTNGSLLIPVFRVEQMVEHYFERTCRNVNDEYPYFKCSKCKCDAVVGYLGSGAGLPSYCPNCGARVVSE